MYIYKLYNTELKKYFATSRSKNPDKHDAYGHAYTNQWKAAEAIKQANIDPTLYEIVRFKQAKDKVYSREEIKMLFHCLKI